MGSPCFREINDTNFLFILSTVYIAYMKLVSFSEENDFFPAGKGTCYIQQPGSPLFPQQVFMRMILRRVFLMVLKNFSPKGIGFLRFSITAFVFGRLSSHMTIL